MNFMAVYPSYKKQLSRTQTFILLLRWKVNLPFYEYNAFKIKCKYTINAVIESINCINEKIILIEIYP